MKRTTALILSVIMLFLLAACGSTAPSQAPATAAPADQAEAAPATPDPSSAASQAQVIFNNLAAVTGNADYSTFWFTVTDLDHNGHLELIAAVTEGTGSYTRAVAYEVTPSFDSISPITIDLGTHDALPEIIVKSADTYKTAEGVYNYIFTDTTSTADGKHLISIENVALKNGTLTTEAIVNQLVEYIGNITVYTTTDADGNNINISPDDLDKQADNKFAGATKTSTNFEWVALASITSSSVLENCYNVFNGGAPAPAAPVVTVAPSAVVTPAPTPTIQVVDAIPQVTKDPTDEYLYAGGNCSFVSYATAYQYVSWSLVDRNGNIYGATTTPFLQLGVSGANSTCLSLSNVPIEMDGWRARATFYGKTNVSSRDAYLHVSQAPVVVKTVTASPQDGYFTASYNTIYLYSSTGENIHYEAIRSGDTGPYASDNIPSGGGVPIIGIDGQFLSVTVYCNVIGSDKTFQYSYVVDCSPAPTPDPGPQTVRGTLGTMDSMNSVPIIIYGSTYYTTRDFITPQGEDLYAGRGCTVYYSGSFDNITSVVLDP